MGTLKRAVAFLMIAAVLVIALIANLGYSSTAFAFVDSVPGADRTLHFGLYFLLSLAVVSWTASWGGVWATARGLARVVGLLIFFISLEELSQSLFPSRSLSILDLTASVSGLVVGGLVVAGGLRVQQSMRGKSLR